jgi:hypothetical protein
MGLNEPVISKTVTDENSNVLKIDYFVTNGISLTDGTQGIPSFGICVQLSIDGKISESSAVNDVSPDKETVMRLLQLFAKNLVTPVSLKDVVEDCVAAQLQL